MSNFDNFEDALRAAIEGSALTPDDGLTTEFDFVSDFNEEREYRTHRQLRWSTEADADVLHTAALTLEWEATLQLRNERLERDSRTWARAIKADAVAIARIFVGLGVLGADIGEVTLDGFTISHPDIDDDSSNTTASNVALVEFRFTVEVAED